MTKTRVLKLTLKKKWFDMVASGERKEDYRPPSQWIISRLEGREYDRIEFSHGYGPNVPKIDVEYLGCTFDRGNPEWGAGPKRMVIIRLGRVLTNPQHTCNDPAFCEC